MKKIILSSFLHTKLFLRGTVFSKMTYHLLGIYQLMSTLLKSRIQLKNYFIKLLKIYGCKMVILCYFLRNFLNYRCPNCFFCHIILIFKCLIFFPIEQYKWQVLNLLAFTIISLC